MIKKSLLFLIVCIQVSPGWLHGQDREHDLQLFLSFFKEGPTASHMESIHYFDENWNDAYLAPLLEVIYFVEDPKIYDALKDLLERQTGLLFGFDIDKWYQYIWLKEENTPSYYTEFKAELYKLIDPKFHRYFKDRDQLRNIRLDEVRWGGVLQDGIPPLRQPKMISVHEASYLQDDNVVFGIEVNGDFRAYPKRILAWHEMFVDEVGGVKVAGVYCTLCGTVILYETELNGKNYELGTSGFLYRSNKMMYDKETQSLWNTLWGSPSIGPLVGQDIKLKVRSVVTTTWKEWRTRHPETTVLSLQTGHRRDYDEGIAYKDYFATDNLMFTVPSLDNRLKNKDEILAVRLENHPNEAMAISTRFLSKNRIYHHQIGDQSFVVLTDKSGANRVYETEGRKFKKYFDEFTVVDKSGVRWEIHEDGLYEEDGIKLERLPHHRAFWFGWRAAFPKTRLIK